MTTRVPGTIRSVLGRVLTEPLVHFLLVGGAIFWVMSASGDEDAAPPGRIEVTDSATDRMAANFEATWRRPPNAGEMTALIEDFVREEIYVREALALGLDRDDAVIRRRLRQKMEFLTTSIAGSVEPKDDDLRAYFSENSEKYTLPGRIEFEQIFLGERPGEGDVASVREALSDGADPNMLGQRTMLPQSLGPAVGSTIDRNFGRGFSSQMDDFKVGTWQGPIQSSFGLHLVRVLQRFPATEPDLESVRDDVREDWRRANIERITAKSFERLRTRYEIVRPNAAKP